MTPDSYKIVISISHHRISYEYWQRDGEDKLVPMPSGSWPAPLAFYCSDTGIIMGEDAVRAAHSGITNAFDNYFERLVEDKSYIIGGQTRPIRNLLLDASETIFRDFFSHVLFNRCGSLSDNRAKMPLTIVCESDVKSNERALLHGLFKDSGYNRVRVVEYDRYISQYVTQYLSKEYICDKVVVAWSESTDMTFSIFDVNNSREPVVENFENLGIDPRKEYVERLIWERVIGQNSWLNKSTEQDAISKAAADFLSSNTPLINGTILLSDGQQYHYSLNRNTIDCFLSPDGVSIKDVLEQFLKDNGITNRARVLLLLRGIVAGNTYFEQNLSPGFSRTIKTNNKLRDNTMNLIITEVMPAFKPDPKFDRPKVDVPNDRVTKVREITKKWRQVKAEANAKKCNQQPDVAVQILRDFLSECRPVSGVEDVIHEIADEIAKYDTLSQPREDKPDNKSLERKWREVRANAKAKQRAGNQAEARSIIQTFLDTVRKEPGTDGLVALIENELSSIVVDLPKPPKQKSKVIQTQAANEKGNSGRGSRTQIQASPSPSHIKIPDIEKDGENYIKQGKLKEARDWYRSHNDINMAHILSEIIRSKKGIEIRKATLKDYRESKNREQIVRIISEIQDFITLCERAGVNSNDYKKILSEYRKI